MNPMHIKPTNLHYEPAWSYDSACVLFNFCIQLVCFSFLSSCKPNELPPFGINANEWTAFQPMKQCCDTEPMWHFDPIINKTPRLSPWDYLLWLVCFNSSPPPPTKERCKNALLARTPPSCLTPVNSKSTLPATTSTDVSSNLSTPPHRSWFCLPIPLGGRCVRKMTSNPSCGRGFAYVTIPDGLSAFRERIVLFLMILDFQITMTFNLLMW